MRRFVLVALIAAAIVPFVAIGCGSEDGSAADDDGDAGTGSPTGVDGSDASSESATASGEVALPFAPSNVEGTLDVSGLTGDLVYQGTNCGNFVNFDPGKTGCAEAGATYKSFETYQKDGSKVRVFVARNIRIEEATEVRVMGSLPVVFIALGTIEIFGSLNAAADKGTAVAGGFGPPSSSADGLGPGGGRWSADQEGGGAGYCGRGGASGGGASGGVAYGSAELLPLYGGSSGGGQFSGAGGGALQLVAGTSIRVGATGVIHAGGGGGDGSGGGSGGALLVEAPDVTVLGTLAANGGGGAAGTGASDGENAKPGASAAMGGPSHETPAVEGGAGSSSADASGVAGQTDPRPSFAFHGSGGGGAGRIRVNTRTARATLTGTISPALATGCASEGVLGVNVRSDAGPRDSSAPPGSDAGADAGRLDAASAEAGDAAASADGA